jgi:next-to-BRCA1 protein 1
VYERDTIADGTVMPPNHIFEQTWVLRNAGTEAWPAGCSVKYVGGDYMGHVNSNHPAGVKELISASESTICYAPLAPGQTFSFTVLLRTPPRDGKVISYWRLTTPNGLKFGHRLWCDVEVQSPKPEEPERTEEVPVTKEEVKEETAVAPETRESQMIFPRLDKESPVASVHESVEADNEETSTEAAEEFEDCNEDEEWDESEDGFMTDEEYDILDASDEEYLSDSQKKPLKK